MKKLATLALVLAFGAGLVGCSNSSTGTTTKTSSSTTKP